jgi:cysteine-rich repeat protein
MRQIRFFFLVLFGLSVPVFFGGLSVVLADTTNTNVSVGATVGAGAVCGNGIIEGGEVCDDGVGNGSCPASCGTSCATNSCGNGGGGDVRGPSIAGVSVIASITSATVSWSATDLSGVSFCSFEYGTTMSYGSSVAVSGSYQSLPSGLTASTPYFFRIRCVDSLNNATEELGTFTTTAITQDITAPIISSVTTTTQQTTAVISWSATDTSGISACSLVYGITPSFGSSGLVSGAYQSSLTGLIPNTAYNCQITCVDIATNNASAECNFRTISDGTPPPDVSSFSASGANATNNLSWLYSESVSDFSYYRVEWSVGSCPARGTGTLLSQIANNAQLSIQHTGVTNGLTYYYRLSVYDTSGNASVGVCASATPTVVLGICGDGVVDVNEQCDDGNSVNTDACLNSCLTATCGDSVVRAGVEQCDAGELNGASCVSRGFDGGVLACTACVFNTSACANAPIVCGNGVVNVGETCDDGNNNQNDGCTNLCQAAICGDNVVRSGVEQCDGSDLGDASCTTLGYLGGSLSCSVACTYNATSCVGGAPIGSGVEECTNAIDDDLDGLTDCDDSDCSTYPACTGVFVCADGLDNDGDGFIDLQDVGCSSTSDNDEYNALEVTVPENSRITAPLFWIAERTISVTPIDGVVKSLTGDQLTVGIHENELYQVTPSTTVTLVVQGTRYVFVRGEDAMYRADVLFPAVGVYDAFIEVFYAEGVIDSLTFRIESAPYGVVFDENEVRLGDAVVSLLDQDGNVFDLGLFRQGNPYVTNESGVYGFVVPNGQYTVLVTKQGYQERRAFSFRVTDNVVNRSVVLLKLPETVSEAIAFVTAVSVQRVQDAVIKVNDIADIPVVEEITSDVVVPTLATVTTISIVPSLFSITLPLLRFLFLQPLLIVGRRKRQAWGVVYSSLNKLPIDLATIRLVDKKTGRVVQSRVTDSKGRYLFMVEQGEYTIEVFKQGFVFPSKLLASIKEDGSFLDIYHGESIVVESEETHLAPNIPLDPVEAREKTVKRIVIETWLRRLQYIVAVVGIIGAVISLYVAPSGITIGFLMLHILLGVMFIRYAKPKKPKGWGLVYDNGTAQPIGRAVARLFSKQFDKLVATQVTDSKGRYSFLVGPNDYYATFEKKGYVPEKTDFVVVKEENGLVAKDVALKKEGTTSQLPSNSVENK